MILSSRDAEAVALLSQGVPDLKIGYDPCSDEALDQLLLVQNPNFERFVLDAVEASPNALMIYLYFHLVLEAAMRDAHCAVRPDCPFGSCKKVVVH